MIALSKNQLKFVNSLHKKKFRDQNRLFIAEGQKLVSDLLNSDIIAHQIYYIENCDIKALKSKSKFEIDSKQMNKISCLKTPSNIFAIFEMPSFAIITKDIQNSLSIVLDGIQDPGNLGTIIRIADWFGIDNIFCSHETADIYNPKVVQATMGALARVKIHYTDLNQLIKQYSNSNFPIYGTFLDGEIIYKTKLDNKGFIIMGNEGKGVSKEIGKLVNKKLFIPNFPSDKTSSESLNVSVATSIICSEFRRVNFI